MCVRAGNSGWSVVDSYSCGSGECGGYGVDHSIVQVIRVRVIRVRVIRVRVIRVCVICVRV